MNKAAENITIALEKRILDDLLSNDKIDKSVYMEETERLNKLENTISDSNKITYKQFVESYTSNVKDIMLQIYLNEYKCNQWGNVNYMQDWRNWILSQRFDYYRFMPNHMFMAFNDNKLVGFASVKKINNNTVELRRLYVISEYRRQGIGGELYKRIFSEINKISGITSIQVIVCAPLIEAINFFEKRGFKITFMDVKKMEYRMENSTLY